MNMIIKVCGEGSAQECRSKVDCNARKPDKKRWSMQCEQSEQGDQGNQVDQGEHGEQDDKNDQDVFD